MTQIKINIVEVSSILAHNAMWDEIQNPLFNYNPTNQEELYEEDENGNEVYKEEYQKIFDKWYDYFYDKINSNKKIK